MSTSGVMTLILAFMIGMLFLLTRPWANIASRNNPPLAVVATPTVSPILPKAAPNTGNTQTAVSTVKLKDLDNSGQSGSATVFDQNGKANIVVVMDEAVPGSAFPAYVVRGSCGTTAGDTIYPLTPVSSGKSVTLLDVPMDSLKSELPLSITVNQTDTDYSPVLACGQLSL